MHFVIRDKRYDANITSKTQTQMYKKLVFNKPYRLSQPPGFTLRLEQGQDVSITHRPLHVPDDLTAGLPDELNFHLGTLSLGAGTAQDLNHASQNVGLIHFSLVIELNEKNTRAPKLACIEKNLTGRVMRRIGFCRDLKWLLTSPVFKR